MFYQDVISDIERKERQEKGSDGFYYKISVIVYLICKTYPRKSCVIFAYKDQQLDVNLRVL